MLIYRPDEPLALSGTDVLIAAGDADPYSPAEQVEELAEVLAAGGAEVELVRQATGHGLVQGDLDALAGWIEPAGGRHERVDPAATRMGAVHLTVADLARSLEYYRGSIGLDVLAQGDGRATLGAGETRLLELVEEPGAQPAPGRTGLFHFALLLPDRRSLRSGSRTRCASACAWRARPTTS